MEDQTDVIGSSTAENKELGRTVNESRQQNLSEMTSLTVSSTPGPSSSQTDYNDSLNNSSSLKETCSVKYNSFLGFFYLCLGALCTGLLSVIVKEVSYINPSQLSLIRNVGIFTGALPIVVYTAGKNLGDKKDILILSFRAFLLSTGFYMIIIAYRYLPLMEVAVVRSAQPIVTTVLARLCIKEACGVVLTISLILTLLGVLLSVRVPKILHDRDSIQISSYYLGGLGAAIASLLLLAISQVFMRKLRHVHFSVTMLCAGFVGIIENAAISAAAFPFVPSHCGWDQILCILVGIFSFMECTWDTLAIQMLPAGLATVEKSSLNILVFAAFQILFFYEYPDICVISGACLVTVSLGLIGLKNWILILPEESTMRKKLKYFLY